MPRVLLAVGANLGERRVTLDRSLSALTCLPNAHLLARSDWHETSPVGGPAHQPEFLNGAILLDTSIPPHDLAQELKQIELQLGRERHARWDARTIDLDMLLYGDQTITTVDLQIPHPRMAFRRFVLDPACEIAGETVHPLSGWTLAALRRHWQTRPHTVFVQSANRELREWLAQELVKQFRAMAHDQPNSQTIELLESDTSPTMRIELGGNTTSNGPVVHIDSTERQTILQEALAAVTAAWPE